MNSTNQQPTDEQYFDHSALPAAACQAFNIPQVRKALLTVIAGATHITDGHQLTTQDHLRLIESAMALLDAFDLLENFS